MKQYLDLLRHIKDNGIDDGDRTGTGARSVFGCQMRFNLKESFPLLTTKKLHLKSIIHELLWFLNGDTNIKYLKDNGVSIWDEWADERGELGPIYGRQWRSWDNFVLIPAHSEGAEWIPEEYVNKPIDQISWLINRLKTNPQCRRMIVSAWNVADIPKMKLAPCHCLFQFYTAPMSLAERIAQTNVLDNVMAANPEIVESILDQHNVPKRKLSCQLYQRSVDSGLGLPYNIASYSLLTTMIAQCVNMIPHEFIWTGGNTHIYFNHFSAIEEQLTRTPRQLPRIIINPLKKDIFSFEYKDFTLVDYDPLPSIKMDISI